MKPHKRESWMMRFLSILMAAALTMTSVDVTAFASEASEVVQEAEAEEVQQEDEDEAEDEAEVTEEEPQEADSEDAGDPAEEEDVDAEEADELEEAEPTESESEVAADAQTETVELNSEDQTDLDNDELFAGYARKMLYGDSGIATYGTIARSHLSEEEKAAYDILKVKITNVACNGGSTRFNFSSGELVIGGYATESDSSTAVSKIWQALKTDCPYELYWADGSSPSTSGGGGQKDGKYYIELTQFTLIVATDYRYNKNNITVDATQAKAVAAAVENAKAIVAQWTGEESVYERLNGYKNAIKDLTSYNGKADSLDYVQQLINVFDGDPSTGTGYEGYARAFQYLCDLDAGGIKCYTVSGILGYWDPYLTQRNNHTWNVVRLRKKNYLVDVSLCDGDGISGGIAEGSADGSVQDKLFLVGGVEEDKGGRYVKKFNNNGSREVAYRYDKNTMASYTESERIISSTDYVDRDPLPLDTATITIAADTDIHEDNTFTYDAQNHDVVVTLGEEKLVAGEDYTLTITKDGEAYSGAIRNVGTYKIVVEGEEGYTGSVEKTVTIEKRPVTPSIIEKVEYLTKAYDRTKGAPVRLNYSGECQEWMSYYISAEYEDANVGTGKKVTVQVRLDDKIANNYYLTVDTLTTNIGVITKGDPTLEFRFGGGAYATTYTYSGEALRNPIEKELRLVNVTTGVQIIDYEDLKFAWYKGTSDSGTPLTENPKNAGTYYLKVFVDETENYNAASAGKQITIEPKPVTDPVIELSQDSYEYDGEEKKPEVTVKDGEVVFAPEDYSVSYKDNVNAGDQATVIISRAEGGNYEVSGSKTFTITPADISKAVVTVNDNKNVLYTGGLVTPKVSVALGTKTLEADTDYRVSYEDNQMPGEASVTVTGCGNYKGQATGRFMIAIGDFDGTILYNGKSDGDSAYYSKTVSITAEGYRVTDMLLGSFEPSYSFDSDQEGEVKKTLYFWNPSEEGVYKKEVTVKFDKTAPTGTVKVGAKLWETLLETITFGHYKVAEKTVTIQGKDALSGVQSVEYLISETPKTAEELKGEGTVYTAYDEENKPVLTTDKDQIVYVKITDKAGNAGYLSSDGIILDTTAPTISDIQAVEGADWTDTQIRFKFTVNEEGTYYYVVLPAAEKAPDAETVIAAAQAGGSAGTGATGALTDGSVTIERTATGLKADTEYKVYVVAQDQVYNMDTDANDPNTSEVTAGAVIKTRKAAPVIAEKPAVSGVYGTKVSELTISGGEVTAADVKVAGTWAIAGAEEQDPDRILSVGTTETCVLIFTPDDTEYPSLKADVVPVITARPVKVVIDPVSREYREADPQFTYQVAAEEGFEQLVGDDDLGIVLTTEANTSSTVGQYDITGTASNPNYDVTIAGGEKALTIVQAAIKVVTVVVKDDKKLTYGEKLDTLNLKGTFEAEKSEATVEEGTFTVMDGDVQPGAGTVEVEWIFTPADTNYKPVSGKTNITVEKATPESAESPVVSELTYGQTLAESMLTGGRAVNPITQNEVTGTWKWADETIVPTADNQGYQVIFIPDDTENYNSIEVTVAVIVKKATPAISKAPTAANLTYGQTLAESTLTGGTASVAGTFTWTKADSRPEVKDSGVTAYEVTFTPEDTVNWQTTTTTVTVAVEPKTLTWDTTGLKVLTKM